MEQTAPNDDFTADIRRSLIAAPDEVTDSQFPRLDNISAAFIFSFVPKPHTIESPECVYVPRLPRRAFAGRDESIRYELAINEWNMLWEAGQLRHDFFDDKLPAQLDWLRRHAGRNITLVPLERPTSYQAYAPLYHLLPLRTVQRFGLPIIKKGLWPQWMFDHWINKFLPRDFNSRLAQAFAEHIWPYLVRGSGPRAFSSDDSIRLLAHNLDFWMPYADEVVYERLRTFHQPVRLESSRQRALKRRLLKHAPEDIDVSRPLTGGYVWDGLQDVDEVTARMVEVADARGNLRSLIDAIRSHRVEEDFSHRWSYAREDFERKLHRKRAKVKVSFVELNNTIPVHAPTSEVHENLLWQDFLAILSVRESRIVVCLRSGVTKIGDVARELGYASHSPVSRALARIRSKAKAFLDGAT